MILFCYTILNMKHTLHSFHLLVVLMVWALALSSAGMVKGLEIKPLTEVTEHVSRLHSLYLWRSSFAGMIADSWRLNITNGLVVWNSSVGSVMVTVGWGIDNGIGSSSQWAGIAGWQQNNIQSDSAYSVIGGWKLNNVKWKNAVIAWWESNIASDSGAVVLWWNGNESSSQYGMVFGGSGNKALWAYSFVLWEGAVWQQWSFAWNGEATQDSARIDASNWILIGTYDVVDGVNLVVNWAIKIGGDTWALSMAWEIRMVSGCFYAYDWAYWHVVNQSATGCDTISTMPVAKTCKFGNVELQAWDKVTAYKTKISTNCDSEKSEEAVCDPTDWKVKVGADEYPYPYCYNW